MDFKGMTVNERLYLSGNMDKFDKAVAEKDVDTVIAILKEIEIVSIDIDSILQELGLKKNDSY